MSERGGVGHLRKRGTCIEMTLTVAIVTVEMDPTIAPTPTPTKTAIAKNHSVLFLSEN